jgi:hypothetical protein
LESDYKEMRAVEDSGFSELNGKLQRAAACRRMIPKADRRRVRIIQTYSLTGLNRVRYFALTGRQCPTLLFGIIAFMGNRTPGLPTGTERFFSDLGKRPRAAACLWTKTAVVAVTNMVSGKNKV